MRLVTFLPILGLLLSATFAASPTTTPANQPTTTPASQPRPLLYTPAQINDLVETGKAKPHGAQFANQGMGCLTSLWANSNDHHVFFFARNGTFYGEFRDETLKNQRFIEITEHYLTAGVRTDKGLPHQRELPFIRKHTQYHWEDKLCTASTVTWQVLICTPDGKLLRSDPPHVEKMIRRETTVKVPAEWRSDAQQYYLAASRPVTGPHELAFG